jgi:probable HAF family extracellular repeat protein
MRAAATFVWVALILSPARSRAEPPAIYNLGTLGGGFSGGYSVNDAGQVTGYSPPAPNTYQHAFRYDGTPGAGGVMRDLGTLGGTFSEGYGVNKSGQVAGYSKLTEDSLGFSDSHAFRYDGTPGSGGVMRDLGTLGGTNSGGWAINDAGQVAGSSLIESSAQHAFRYDGTPGAGGVMRDLGTLVGTGSDGYGINNAGQVAGSSDIAGDAAKHAFRYDGTPGAGGVMRDLGTLGGTYSGGQAINDAGQVTGSSSIAGDTASHAFLYTGTPGSGGVMRDLGTLGGSNSSGRAVNDSGQVAGNSQITGDTAYHAFLYTGTPGAGGMMIDLDVWLDANNPTEGARWTLLGARGLTDGGLITGVGLYDPDGPGGITADSRAYLLDASSIVPEPSALALLGLGGLTFLRRRRRP